MGNSGQYILITLKLNFKIIAEAVVSDIGNRRCDTIIPNEFESVDIQDVCVKMVCYFRM